MNERLELYSPLSPEECARRISDAMDSERSALFSDALQFGSRPVAGRVDACSIKLRKRIRYRNAFQSFLTAKMHPEGSGTIVSGEFAMQPFMRVILRIWSGSVILIGGAFFVATVSAYLFSSTPRGDNAWIIAVVPLGMIVSGFAIVRFGRYLARNEARFITDFLIHALNANDRNAL